jgi:hypothetical protein
MEQQTKRDDSLLAYYDFFPLYLQHRTNLSHFRYLINNSRDEFFSACDYASGFLPTESVSNSTIVFFSARSLAHTYFSSNTTLVCLFSLSQYTLCRCVGMLLRACLVVSFIIYKLFIHTFQAGLPTSVSRCHLWW